MVGPLIGMCAYKALSQKRVARGERGSRQPTPTSPAILVRQLPRLQGYLKGFYFQLQSLPKWVCGPLQASPCLFWACSLLVGFFVEVVTCSNKYDSEQASHLMEHDFWLLTSAGQTQVST